MANTSQAVAEGAAAGSAFGGWGALAGGALGAIGSVFGSKKSSSSAKKIAAMQLAWEREKAQNSIQWGVQDAIKAGINPAVAVNTNSNAGSINPPMPDTSGYNTAGQQLTSGINSAISYNQMETAKKLAESQGFKNIMEGLESGERTNAIPKQLENQTRDSLTAAANQRAQERHTEQQNQLLEQQTVYQSLENSMKEIESEVNSGNFAKAMLYINMTLNTLKNAGGVAQSFINPIALWKGAKSAGELKQMITTFKNSNAFKLMNNYKGK